MINSMRLATFLEKINNNDLSNKEFLKYDSDFNNYDFLIATK